MRFLRVVPSLISVGRLLAGPLYFAWGNLPATSWQLAFLGFAAASDAIDGRLARRMGVASTAGAIIDATADKTLVAFVLLKFVVSGGVSESVLAIVLLQFALLATAGSLQVRGRQRHEHPGLAARGGALATVVALLVGVSLATTEARNIAAVSVILATTPHCWQSLRTIIKAATTTPERQ